MPIEWSPAAHARPMEWLMRVTESQQPYAVVRRFLKGDPNRPDEWYRVVTWAPTSDGRELIGWVRTLEAASALAWDHKCAYESWRHHLAARRVDAGSMTDKKPAAAEMVKFWRAQQARTAPTGGAAPPATSPAARTPR